MVKSLFRDWDQKSREDSDASAIILRKIISEGIDVKCGFTLSKVDPIKLRDSIDGKTELDVVNVTISSYGSENQFAETLEVDALLIASGREPNIERLNLEIAEVKFSPEGIEINDYMQTSNPDVYVVGDVAAGSPKFTHNADFMARGTLRNAIFFGKERICFACSMEYLHRSRSRSCRCF